MLPQHVPNYAGENLCTPQIRKSANPQLCNSATLRKKRHLVHLSVSFYAEGAEVAEVAEDSWGWQMVPVAAYFCWRCLSAKSGKLQLSWKSTMRDDILERFSSNRQIWNRCDINGIQIICRLFVGTDCVFWTVCLTFRRLSVSAFGNSVVKRFSFTISLHS